MEAAQVPQAATVVLASYFHTPGAAALAAFPVVVRAGHLRAAADYRIERRRSPGHDVLFCLSGRGSVRVGNRTFAVQAEEIAWIDGYQPHAHWAHPAEPWELLWLRLDGAGVAGHCRFLGAESNPVFRNTATADLRKCFLEILRLMGQSALDREETIHVVIAQLVALLKRSRRDAGTADGTTVSEALAKTHNRMALYPNRSWTAAELARLAGMSVPVFYRAFRQLTGASPIDWLRRERITLAKRRLLESDDAIQSIAEQAGYNSAFYFSRDFKRHTGQSPSAFRLQERSGTIFGA